MCLVFFETHCASPLKLFQAQNKNYSSNFKFYNKSKRIICFVG